MSILTKSCIVEDCSGDKYYPIQGLCRKHYARWLRHKDVTYKLPQGFRHGKLRTPEYAIWTSMKQRCMNESYSNYKYYGGRGIKVCERWLHSYKNFITDMGPRPSNKYSIERIDNDGNYEPSNCKWATMREQAQNKRKYNYV